MRTCCTLLLLLGGLLLAGCATTAKIQSWEPAVHDIDGIHRIAVMDFDGPQGGEAAEALTSRLQATGFYQIVDRAQWHPVLESARQGNADRLQAVSQMGRSLGLDAVVLGTVTSYACNDESLGANMSETVNISIGKVERQAEVAILVQVFDVRTGKVRLEDRASRSQHKDFYGDADLPETDKFLRGMWEECFDELASKLAPQKKEVEVKLAQASWFQANGSKIREGNSLAKKNNWQAAQAAWQSALEKDPNNHALMYNLALACEAQRNYAQAETYLQQAMTLDDDGRYVVALTRVRDERIDFVRTEQQRLARNRSAQTPPALAARNQPAATFPAASAAQNGLPQDLGYASGAQPVGYDAPANAQDPYLPANNPEAESAGYQTPTSQPQYPDDRQPAYQPAAPVQQPDDAYTPGTANRYQRPDYSEALGNTYPQPEDQGMPKRYPQSGAPSNPPTGGYGAAQYPNNSSYDRPW